jgi:hypothetical protein
VSSRELRSWLAYDDHSTRPTDDLMLLRSSHARRFVVSVLIVFGMTRPAHADVTAFLGLSPTPDNRGARGFSGGFSLLVVGFEFEYSNILEDESESLPSLKTWSGNVLLQTPVEVHGVQLYGTAGGGGYRERLVEDTVTHAAVNLGGGAKIRVAGPLRVRFDYRIFKLQGSPRYSPYHRFYAGANLAF